MPVERLTPRDRAAWLAARAQDVTASQIGALFGVHEYQTPFGLWALKTQGLDDDVGENAAVERGALMEEPAVQLIKKRNPRWKVTHNAKRFVYFRDPEARLGATPDVIVVDKARGVGVIQIKSVDAFAYKSKWLNEEGEPEPPLWIALQATLEAHLVGANWAAVAAFVWGSRELEMPIIDVPIVPALVASMRSKVAEFWQMVAEGRVPPMDYSRDAETIDRLYKGDDDVEVDLSGDNRLPELLSRRAAVRAAAKAAAEELSAIEAEVKAKMGDATVAHIGQGRRITWKSVSRAGHFVPPSTGRQLRFPNIAKE